MPKQWCRRVGQEKTCDVLDAFLSMDMATDMDVRPMLQWIDIPVNGQTCCTVTALVVCSPPVLGTLSGTLGLWDSGTLGLSGFGMLRDAIRAWISRCQASSLSSVSCDESFDSFPFALASLACRCAPPLAPASSAHGPVESDIEGLLGLLPKKTALKVLPHCSGFTTSYWQTPQVVHFDKAIPPSHLFLCPRPNLVEPSMCRSSCSAASL